MSYKILTGNAAEQLIYIENETIQSTITSPPYFNLRNYSNGHNKEIGREKDISIYIDNLVKIFEILKNKTREDGLLFLNLGDTYVNGCLSGVPWRVALALIDIGWILRSDIIWHKPNAMPSSVKNRPTTDHEYIFMFSKNKKYQYFQDAIREPHITFSENSKMKGGRNHLGKRNGTPEKGKNEGNSNLHDGRWDQAFHPLGRNKRTVWNIPLGKCRGRHFDVFPEQLVETCIKASSKEGDLICDPFTGSGTTGLGATKMKRDFIGIELVSEYADLAKSRIMSQNLELF